jgi:uncharacterized cupredoxin-like copper-binding protein
MSRGETRRAVVAFIVAVLVVGGASAALVSTASARAASALKVDTSNTLSVTAEGGYSFTPNAVQQLPTNTNISVTVTDNDILAHTFTIIGREGWVIPTDASDGEIAELSYGHQYPALLAPVNVSPMGGGGDQVKVTLQSPGVGWYEFVCSEPGHFQQGMYGFLAFGENLPNNLTVIAADTDPGTAVFIIVGTIVGLVVVALVLGFIVGRRRGGTYEMPPQRLGYAEPEPPAAAPIPESPPPHSEEPRG